MAYIPTCILSGKEVERIGKINTNMDTQRKEETTTSAQSSGLLGEKIQPKQPGEATTTN